VEKNIFESVYVSKTVTVRVPSGAVSSYNTAWNAFRGAGNTGDSGTVNTNINLIIQGY
jgi:hypothetical protein